MGLEGHRRPAPRMRLAPRAESGARRKLLPLRPRPPKNCPETAATRTKAKKAKRATADGPFRRDLRRRRRGQVVAAGSPMITSITVLRFALFVRHGFPRMSLPGIGTCEELRCGKTPENLRIEK